MVQKLERKQTNRQTDKHFTVSSNVYPAMTRVVALPGPYPYGPLLSVHLWHLRIKSIVIMCYTMNPSLNLTNFSPSRGFLLSALMFTLLCQEWLLCLGHTLMALCLVST